MRPKPRPSRKFMRWVVLALPLLGGAAQAEPAPSSPAAASPGYSLGQGHSTPLPDGAALDLVWIKPGTFLMGSPDGEAGHQQSEQPRTTVTISRGFWMGKTHVTQRQYQAVMGTNPSHFVNAGPEAPVEQVSWDEAMEFCRRLTEQERTAGRIPEGYAYTLPTAAQWEYACRGGTTGPRYGDLDAIAWYKANSGGTTHPVGQKQPNAYGLYDMIGNLWEWCADWWSDEYPGGNVVDPTGPATGPGRVGRGGSWNRDPLNCRAAGRGRKPPGSHFNYLGFRVALSSLPAPGR